MKYNEGQIIEIISILKRFNIPDAKAAMIVTNLNNHSIYYALEKVKEAK